MNPPTNPSKNHASSPLDTEIRRAMGELANAAPPARPAESFTAESLRAGSTRPEFQPLRTSSSDQPSGQRGWLLAAAAAVVIAVVGVSLVLVNSDDPTTTISDVPPTPGLGPEAAVEPLAGDALLAEVAGRRWVALERFDDPSPTARTPEFTVTAAAGGPIVEGFDGCNTYRGAFSLDDATIVGGDVQSTTVGCGVETLGFGGSIELAPDASTLALVDLDGAQLARFHDLARLAPASADDMPYTFLADDLETVTFTVSGVGVTDCTRLGWADTEGAVTVSFLETLSSCNADDVAIVDWLTDITSDGAEVFVTPGGLLLADPSSALQLVRPPVVEVDPDGVTLAAGAIYGIEPGTGVSPDDVLDVVVPRLGPPDLDTGWVAAGDLTSETMNPVFNPCSDVTGDYRELWWGDLSFGFWGSGSRTDLQFWNVGDRRLQFGPDTPGTPPTITTGLTTEAGIGVGSAAASIPDDVATASSRNVGQADRFDGGVLVWVTSVVSANPEFTPGGVAPPIRSGEYLVADGVVVAFGSSPVGC